MHELASAPYGLRIQESTGSALTAYLALGIGASVLNKTCHWCRL